MIETKRLKLIPVSFEHAVDIFELWSDYEVIKYTYVPLMASIEACKERIKIFVDQNIQHGAAVNFSILLDEKVIGLCGFPVMDILKGEYAFYYQLNRKYWGKGYGYEVATTLLDYIVKHTQAQVIYADAVSINPASIEILSRVGFQQTHVQTNEFDRNNLLLDVVHFKYEV